MTRVAVAYSVVGFIVWQAAEIALPALGLPDQALTLVVVLTVLGFPMALVLSWAYELRPEEPRPDTEDAARATGADVSAPIALPSPLARALPGNGTRTHRVLVVDDDSTTLLAHAELVRHLGHEVEVASDGLEAMAKLSLDVDLVMLDADMPHLDGYEVARRIRSDPTLAYLPIVMVTGLTRPEDRTRAIEVGINDFVLKPIDPQEFKLRSEWLLELKSAYDRLTDQQALLEAMVQRRTAALREALEEMTEARRQTQEVHLDTIHRLTVAAEYVDRAAEGHITRVGLYAEAIARTLGLEQEFVERIRHAAPMHDVGKIGVPPDVLMKPGALDDGEWALMRAHTTIGAEVLRGSPSPLIQMGERIARSHHERWDGRGYPDAIAGERIPLEARICAVADVFDSMSIDRPQREALEEEEVLHQMRTESGRHFDPSVLEAFLGSLDTVREIRGRVR